LTVLIPDLLSSDCRARCLGKQGDRVLYYYPELHDNLEKLKSAQCKPIELTYCKYREK
jgi:hypothetical protein